ncbi:hypothetical protein Tsubulata_022412 [Turnera subulata]|uniref:Uncharacterized protein n=1 Tax=Turnera subulata TaxID=218843 RepID=A0A9Q0JCF1_9ROSI|nr:hypothetical protein Tsubulata_022412 [Turnera subulata]
MKILHKYLVEEKSTPFCPSMILFFIVCEQKLQVKIEGEGRDSWLRDLGTETCTLTPSIKQQSHQHATATWDVNDQDLFAFVYYHNNTPLHLSCMYSICA